jgi:hypothetical protein
MGYGVQDTDTATGYDSLRVCSFGREGPFSENGGGAETDGIDLVFRRFAVGMRTVMGQSVYFFYGMSTSFTRLTRLARS